MFGTRAPAEILARDLVGLTIKVRSSGGNCGRADFGTKLFFRGLKPIPRDPPFISRELVISKISLIKERSCFLFLR